METNWYNRVRLVQLKVENSEVDSLCLSEHVDFGGLLQQGAAQLSRIIEQRVPRPCH